MGPVRWHLFADGALERIDVRKEFSTLRFVGGTVIYDLPGKLTWPEGSGVLVRLMRSNRGTYRLQAYASERTE